MIALFFREWLLVLAGLGALSLAGGFALRPFRENRPFLWLASPLAGLCTLSFFLSMGYFSNLTLTNNLVFSFAVCAGATLWFLVSDFLNGIRPEPRALALPLALVLGISACCTASLEESTLRAGSPNLLYIEGYLCSTDTLGYAHLADWFATHTTKAAPIADPAKPYESWPSFIVANDTRFGCMLIHAAIARLRGLSGAFAYDYACAIYLSTGLLGFAGGFARCRTSLLFLVAGAAVSCWFDYSRMGFMGKLLAYPSVTLLFALVSHPDILKPCRAHALVLLALGAGLLHNGMSISIYSFIAGTGLLLHAIWYGLSRTAARMRREEPPERPPELFPQVFDLALVCAVSLASAGFMLKIILESFKFDMVPWSFIAPNCLDLGHAWMPINNTAAWVLFILALAVQAALAGIAFYRGFFVAGGLLACGLLYLAIAWPIDSGYLMYQASGTLYPFALAGAAGLIVDAHVSSTRKYRNTVVTLCILLVMARVPRMIGSIGQFLGSNVPVQCRYSKSSFDAIQDFVGSERVLLKISNVYRAEVAMVELGGRGVPIQLDAKTWQTLVSYRGWKQPKLVGPITWALGQPEDPLPSGSETVFTNAQYRLMRVNAATEADVEHIHTH